jgi:nucleotide-binding universal stress UspA family protein
MRIQFKTILVATDLTHSGSCALEYAKKIAQSHQATLVIVHAIDPAGYAFPGELPEGLAKDKDVREALRVIEEETREQGIPVHSVVETGVIYERILQAVADHHADLLVLGTRVAAKVGRAALGTVARRLLASAPCPILTVPPSARASLERAGHWRRVLVAIDFSAASLSALRHAQCIAASQLFVVHATADAAGGSHRHHLERLRLLAPFNESHTLPVEHIVTHGEVGKVIADHASRLRADLVVLGSPLNELQEDDFQTSTVLQVMAEVNCPVLCVPPVRDAAAVGVTTEFALAH